MKKSIVLMAVIVLITVGCHRAVASEETELPDSESVTASDTETTRKDSYDTLPDITLETETSAPEDISKDLMDVYHIPYHIEYDESGIDYSQYVIENEENFVKWYGSGLEDARWYLGEAQIQSGSIAFTPIELIVQELPSDHYRALRTEDGLYLFEHNAPVSRFSTN